MKFTIEENCDCGGRYVFTAYGDSDFELATCPDCGNVAHLIDSLSVSITAERLLYRSRAELQNGDFSLSIVIAVMAIESYLTRLYFKVKRIDTLTAMHRMPTAAQECEWEKEYPRSGGFPKPIAFVAPKVVGTTFEKYVADSPTASAIYVALPDATQSAPTEYFQKELFRPRNRIAHWGYVNSDRAEADRCHRIAVGLISILREMDRAKYGNS